MGIWKDVGPDPYHPPAHENCTGGARSRTYSGGWDIECIDAPERIPAGSTCSMAGGVPIPRFINRED